VGRDLEEPLSQEVVAALQANGQSAFPVTALIWHAAQDAPATVLVPSALPTITKGQQILSWISGDHVTPVAYAILHERGAELQVLPPPSRNRRRFWFAPEQMDDFQNQVVALARAVELDGSLALALEFFADATRERNDQFRIVRLFNVLECLSSRYKIGGIGSRDAIRILLGVPAGPTCTIQFEGSAVSFDLIALVGKLRDKLVHGAAMSREALALAERPSFDVLTRMPNLISHELQWRAEGEIVKRSNGVVDLPIGPVIEG
jgi:hypothetical protein